MKDLKYILAYVTPATAFFALFMGGIWSFMTVIYGFGIMPLIETLAPSITDNLSKEEEQEKASSRFFDYLLYGNVVIVYSLIACYFYVITQMGVEWVELIGMTASVGIILGTNGINVAHELGHRHKRYEQWMGKALLLPSFYMHFFVEHNRGHHLRVSTPEDPATSRYGEVLYTFWVRSVVMSFISACKLEAKRLRAEGKSVFHWSNEIIWYQVWQAAYLVLIGILVGWQYLILALIIGVIGFLLLETINYIEHYGLMRKKLPSGRYENVNMYHSWNSDQMMGRIMLYELTRHSDHHYKAARKYQVLRHYDESPQLPYGYPASVLLALIPPLWFAIMNKRAKRDQEGQEKRQAGTLKMSVE